MHLWVKLETNVKIRTQILTFILFVSNTLIRAACQAGKGLLGKFRAALIRAGGKAFRLSGYVQAEGLPTAPTVQSKATPGGAVLDLQQGGTTWP